MLEADTVAPAMTLVPAAAIMAAAASVAAGVTCIIFSVWLIDLTTVRHEWHKYKHGDGHSQIHGMYTPQYGIDMGPKPAGRVSRYE